MLFRFPARDRFHLCRSATKSGKTFAGLHTHVEKYSFVGQSAMSQSFVVDYLDPILRMQCAEAFECVLVA